MKQERDDCAVVPSGKNYLLYTTDQVSFDTNIPQGAKPEKIGSFLASINLSDIAAMAGIPSGFLTSLSVPPSFEDTFIESMYRGLGRTLAKYDTELLGGDTKESSVFVASGFAIGSQTKTRTCLRKNVKRGQIVGVTNSLGRSAAGYAFYRIGYRKTSGINMLLDVTPRLKEASILNDHGVRFMMDLSDGLFSALWQMKQDYGTGFRIVEDEIPVNPAVEKASRITGASPMDFAASFGGDYELLFTIDNEKYSSFSRDMEGAGVDVSFIGEVWDGDNIIFDGERWNPVKSRGYEHFSPIPDLGLP